MVADKKIVVKNFCARKNYAEPSTAAILMSFEAIFGALAGWLLLGEVMTAREIFGCVLMLLGMFAAQWSLIKKSL